jgi:hypothetical protein
MDLRSSRIVCFDSRRLFLFYIRYSYIWDSCIFSWPMVESYPLVVSIDSWTPCRIDCVALPAMAAAGLSVSGEATSNSPWYFNGFSGGGPFWVYLLADLVTRTPTCSLGGRFGEATIPS